MKIFAQETTAALTFLLGVLTVVLVGAKTAALIGAIGFLSVCCAKTGFLALSRLLLIDAPAKYPEEPGGEINHDSLVTSSAQDYKQINAEFTQAEPGSTSSLPANVISLRDRAKRRV